ncbi:glycoside hydrolase family 31 protein [Phormidium tenue FACHB-886]|nr:glycoside hydrolase family 31 protein [Phormidium tenue FACHB-886]
MTLDSLKPTSNPLTRQIREYSLKFRFFLGSLFYLTYAPQAYLYSWRRDRIERQAAEAPSGQTVTVPELRPEELGRVEPTASGAIFEFGQVKLEVSFLTADLARVTWQPGVLPVPYAIAKDFETGDQGMPTFQLDQTPAGWSLSTGALKILVGIDGSLSYYDAAGRLFRQELPPLRTGEAWQHEAKLRPEEKIYGLGERAFHLNLRSPINEETQSRQTYKLWNYDAAGMYGTGSDPMYICIPVYVGLHEQGSYLVFYENSFEGEVTLTDSATATFSGGALRYYITIGSPAQLSEKYTELTGRAPLPPRWALGYHQSRWGYRTEAAVRETVETFRSLDLPLSAIHLDIDVQVGFRAFTLDPDRFPLLGKFTQELAAQGVQFITILNPGIKDSRKSKLFIEGQMLDAFCKLPNGDLVVAPVWCGWSVFPDFTNPAVRQWWSRQYEFLLDLGVAGFWHDMNEPAAFIAWGDRSLPKVTRHWMEGRGGDHREAHNIYGLLQAKAGYESLCQYRSNQRPFIVSRAGWASLQRYSWTWTGDVECTWAAMRQTIATVLGLGLSGIPYSGPDIGGFQGNPSAELYVRWFQMSTFLPFYRAHCSNNVEYRAPWTYGEPYLSILRDFLKLRYRLMPYLYTLAWESTQKGYPIVRPLFWYNSDQPMLWEIDDCFYLGDALLVYPVFEEAARTCSILLPPGKWYSFWDDGVFDGEQTIECDVSLEKLPIFVKAGSILPMTENNRLMLHVYLPEQTENQSHLYSDAGDGYAESRLDQLQLIQYPDGIELLWESQGDYPFSYEAVQLYWHGFQPQEIWSSGARLDEQVKDDRYLEVAPFKQLFFKFQS